MTDTPTAALAAYLRTRPYDRRGMEAAERLDQMRAFLAELRSMLPPGRGPNDGVTMYLSPDEVEQIEALGE